jgi:hypothetical protein
VNKKILYRRSLNKEPQGDDRGDQYQQGGAAYFPEFSQADEVGCKINYKG